MYHHGLFTKAGFKPRTTEIRAKSLNAKLVSHLVTCVISRKMPETLRNTQSSHNNLIWSSTSCTQTVVVDFSQW